MYVYARLYSPVPLTWLVVLHNYVYIICWRCFQSGIMHIIMNGEIILYHARRWDYTVFKKNATEITFLGLLNWSLHFALSNNFIMKIDSIWYSSKKQELYWPSILNIRSVRWLALGSINEKNSCFNQTFRLSSEASSVIFISKIFLKK